MTKKDDFLIEILTEELPPKTLLKLSQVFAQQMEEQLKKLDLSFSAIQAYATPRRLALLISDLIAQQSDQVIERKGPALNVAFDASGKPSPACVGFAKSCGVTPEELQTIKTPQGEWVGIKQNVPGKSLAEIMPALIEQIALALPIPKRMRWSDSDTQFVRPVKSVLMLYGDQVIQGKILGCDADRLTRGHRFHAEKTIQINHAKEYANELEKNFVIADFAKRQAMIKQQIADIAQKLPEKDSEVLISSQAFLDEVTGLVEWPEALCGDFDKAFLALPKEILISSMQDHQRYFPLINQGKLLAYFITISNIKSKNPERVVQGNQRVLRARLSDAAFFFNTDQKEKLADRIERLKGIVFQAKLGSLHDKVERISKLAEYIATTIKADPSLAARAGMLSKTDLTTNLVGEFPELQGLMGCYYAQIDKEPADVCVALKEQYMPRFAGDALPKNKIGQCLALADRIDTLVGAFGINQVPTGDKDPYGLRRAALGVLRILIEEKIDLNLDAAFTFALNNFNVKLENKEVVAQLLNFLQERLRALYQEKGISADVFASVAATGITNPLDADARIKAVQAFKKLNEAEALSVANKRVSNILAKYTDAIRAKNIDPAFFESAVESDLAKQLESKSELVTRLYQDGKYDEVLLKLAELRQPIDDFFDQVMVMTEDQARRENRILMLGKLRGLFLQVADIALLQ